jgi:hypothetical protein
MADKELDSLLAEALSINLRNGRGKGSLLRLEAIKQIAHRTYTNPENWRACNIIELRHRETDSYLGTFQEFLHIRVSARKLERITAVDTVEVTRVEFVEGPEWLGGPWHHVVDPPTESEISEIRKAFHPHYWQPVWLHKQAKRVPPRTADQLLDELTME